MARVYSGPTELHDQKEIVYASKTMVVEFQLDRSGIAKIAVGEPLQRATRSAVVQRAMVYAIQISPRGRTLEYVSSWQASDGFTVIAGMRRAACKLVNTSGHAAAVEWGRGGRQRILGQTLDWLNGSSPIGLAKAARSARAKATFNPDLHPRGQRGRFVATADKLRGRAQRAAQIRRQSGT
jgi:hypothetical protein